MSDTPGAKALIQRIEGDPLNIPLYHQLAERYSANGRFPRAELVLRRAIEIAPLARETWMRLGTVLGAIGKWHDAVDAYDRGSALGPGSADELISLAFALLASQ